MYLFIPLDKVIILLDNRAANIDKYLLRIKLNEPSFDDLSNSITALYSRITLALKIFAINMTMKE